MNTKIFIITLLPLSAILSGCEQKETITDSFVEYDSIEFLAEHRDLSERIPLFSVKYPPEWSYGWVGDSGIIALLLASGDLNAAWTMQDYSGASLMIIPIPYSGQKLTDMFYTTLDSGNILGSATTTTINGQDAARAEYTRKENSVTEAVIVQENWGLLIVAQFPIEKEEEFRPFVDAIINTIAISAESLETRLAIPTYDPAVDSLVRLTNDAENEFYPAWSPDGKKIVYAATRDGNNTEIFVANADGSGVNRLTNDPAVDTTPSFSPDGEKIAFASDRTGDYEIYVMNADGSGVADLTNNPANDSAPAWSPNGKRIAFNSSRGEKTKLFVMNADGSEVTQLVNDLDWANSSAWSSDGSKIVCESSEGVCVMNADGSAVRCLTESVQFNSHPTWSPDGKRIAFAYNHPDLRIGQIYVVNADGSGAAILTNDEFNSRYPAWSPDGQQIIFVSRRDSNTDLYLKSSASLETLEFTAHPTVKPTEKQFSVFHPNSTRTPISTPQTPPQENQLEPMVIPSSTTVPTPMITPTPTAVPNPSNFSYYHSAEIATEVNLQPIFFSVNYPTDWVTSWGQDSGATYFLIMSDPDAWKHSSAVMVTILLARGDDFDFQAYKDTFTGLEGKMIGETMLGDLRLVETVSTNPFDQGEVLHLSATIEGDKPSEGLVVEAKMPRSGEALYRPLLEQIINSIVITTKIKSAEISAKPASGTIPTTHTFTLSKFHSNETVLIMFYFEPSGRNYYSYKTTLTVDENGNGEFRLSSEDAMPEGERWVGEYLVRAIGYEGSYAEVLLTFR
jgi:Tol biopolymer transport system component